MSDIEASHAEIFRRPGSYPNFDAEGHWLFWQSAIALVATLAGAMILLASLRSCWQKREG
ncbi:hypothetical protein OAS39_08165 [Pirellulales bacterium]|nr:hypothetical protein [Pirellulales bacterium]